MASLHKTSSGKKLLNKNNSLKLSLSENKLKKPFSSGVEPTSQNENFYKELVELAHEGLTIGDADDNLIFLNPQFAHSLGYKVKELEGRNIMELVDPASALAIKKEMKKRKKGLNSRYEVTLFHKNGEQRYFNLSASPRFSKNGKFIGSMAVYVDVTHKKTIEFLLLKRIRQIDALYKAYSHARIVFPLKKVFNGILESIVQAMPFENVAQVKIKFDDTTHTFPKKIKRFSFNIQVPLLVEGVNRGFLKVGYNKNVPGIKNELHIKEVTDLAENMAKILCKHMYSRELVERHKIIINRAFTGIAVIQNNKIKYANPRFCKMLKYKKSDLLNKSIRCILKNALTNKMLDGGKEHPNFAIRKDGQKLDIMTTCIETTHNGKKAILLRMIDVTDLKRADEKLKNFNRELKNQVREKTKHLRRVNKRLQAMNIIKDEFVSVASHELRSPLTSIRGYLSFLSEDECLNKMDKQYRIFLERAYDNTIVMNHLIDNILDASRLDMGRFNLRMEKTNIIKLLTSLVDGFQFQASEKNLQLSFLNKTSLTRLYTYLDPVRISQVIRNLIDNSIKFSRREKNIVVSLERVNGMLIFRVIDEGVGIAKVKLERIFEKFTQIKDYNKKDESGVGLGLFIAKRIVELHEGKIKAEINNKKGVTMTFTLPINTLKPHNEKNQ